MSWFDDRYVGLVGWEASQRRSQKSMNYHNSDRNGRMYMCGCMKCIRLNGEVNICSSLWLGRNWKYRLTRSEYFIRDLTQPIKPLYKK